ncbi:MAG: hypothetical protein V4757_14885 [Pseudomonadota bacterium]
MKDQEMPPPVLLVCPNDDDFQIIKGGSSNGLEGPDITVENRQAVASLPSEPPDADERKATCRVASVTFVTMMFRAL